MRTEVAAYADLAQLGAIDRRLGDAKTAGTNIGDKTSTAGRVDAEQAKLLKLKKAATQFEAMLLEKWWSSMKHSGLGEEDNSDAGAGTLDSMGMQAMSMAIASAGGFGIAAMLVHSLQAEITAQGATQSPAGGAENASGVKR